MLVKNKYIYNGKMMKILVLASGCQLTWLMEQYGVKVAGMTRSLESAYTVTGPPAGAAITSSIRFPEEDFTMSGAWTLSMLKLENTNKGIYKIPGGGR